MSDKINPDDNALVPYAQQNLIIRSSGLAKRGLESLLGKQERIIHFPTDRSMGQLWIYDTESDFLKREESGFFPMVSLIPKRLLGESIGTVTVPRGKHLKLDVSEEASKDLSPLAKLNSNDLDGIWLPYNYYTVSDAGLVYLKGLTSLKLLSLNFGNINDAGLAHLAGLTSLQSLSLVHTYISDAGLVHLKGLISLEQLDLSFTQVNDPGLAHLKGLTSLQDLRLNGTMVSDAGLAHLKGLTSLQDLRLNRTKISDAALVHLKDFSSLQNLELWNTLVTEAGLAYLRKMLSKTRILK